MQAQEAVQQNQNGVEHTPPAPTQEPTNEEAQTPSTPPPAPEAQPAANSYLLQLQQRRQNMGRGLENLRAQRQVAQEQMDALEAQIADIETGIRRTEGAVLMLDQMIQEEKQEAA